MTVTVTEKKGDRLGVTLEFDPPLTETAESNRLGGEAVAIINAVSDLNEPREVVSVNGLPTANG
jgi:hypothetical protein